MNSARIIGFMVIGVVLIAGYWIMQGLVYLLGWWVIAAFMAVIVGVVLARATWRWGLR